MNYSINALKDSLYSSDFYRKTAASRTGGGFDFLALVSAIQTIILVIGLGFAVWAIPASEVDYFVNQTPEVLVKDGQLSIDKPSPYKIMAHNKTVIIIDTENYNDKSAEDIFSEMRKGDLAAIATKTKVYTRKSDGEFRVYDLSQESAKSTIKFNKDDVRSWVKIASIIFLPITAIFVFFGLWLYKIIQMLIYSLIGLLANAMFNKNLQYGTIQRLTSYTLWPATLLSILLGFLSIHLMTIFSIVITIGYIFFAIKSAEARISTNTQS